MKTYVCQVCSHIAFDQAPIDCPVCRMPIENFENNPDAIKKPIDPDNLSEEEKTHKPAVQICREDSLTSEEECTSVRVKIGEVEHFMGPEHYINFFDLYVDKRYISRVIFTPRRVHPVANLHIPATTGMFRVIANCNVHGSWTTKVNLGDSSAL